MNELNCGTCGNNRFIFPDDPNGPVVCQFCGDSVGTYAEVAEKISEDVFPSKRR